MTNSSRENVRGYAALDPNSGLAPYKFSRRDLRADDIGFEILYAGICHSDIHQVRQEWGPALYPMVPGHEIVGVVTEIGAAVKNFELVIALAWASLLILVVSAVIATLG